MYSSAKHDFKFHNLMFGHNLDYVLLPKGTKTGDANPLKNLGKRKEEKVKENQEKHETARGP